MSSRTYDFIVLGATGVTGARVCERLLEAPPAGLTSWAIAGRSKDRLEKVLADLSKKFPVAFQKEANKKIGVIVADANNHESLVAMSKQGTVLVNVTGPYRYLGLQIMKACIEARCNWVDVSGEPDFLERSEFLYDQAARDAGVTCVGSCGFDSIPADLGSFFVQQQFVKRGGAVCAHIDSFLSIQTDPRVGFVGHSTTFECAVQGISSVSDLTKLRKQVSKENPPPPRLRVPPKDLAPAGGGRLLPFNYKFLSSPVYAFLFPGADASIVRRSQARLLRQHEKENSPDFFLPVQYCAFFTVRSLYAVVCLILGGLMLAIFSKFALGRKLMIDYPGFFTFGAFSHAGPTQEMLDKTRFKMEMFASGYSKAHIPVLKEALATSIRAPNPDVRLKVVVEGREAGYVSTPVYMVAVAAMLLRDSKKSTKSIPPGVFPPAAALHGVADEFFAEVAKGGATFSVEEEGKWEK